MVTEQATSQPDRCYLIVMSDDAEPRVVGEFPREEAQRRAELLAEESGGECGEDRQGDWIVWEDA